MDSETGVMVSSSVDAHTSEVRAVVQATPSHIWSCGAEIFVWDAQRFTLVSRIPMPGANLTRIVVTPEVANVWCLGSGTQGAVVLQTIEETAPCAACQNLIQKRDGVIRELQKTQTEQRGHIAALEDKHQHSQRHYEEMSGELRKCNDLHLRLQRVVLELTQQRDEEASKAAHLEAAMATCRWFVLT